MSSAERLHRWQDGARALRHVCDLSGRRWRVAWPAHLALGLITLAVLTVWLVFWAHAAYLGASVSGRVQLQPLPADALVISPQGDGALTYDAYDAAVNRLYGYKLLEAGTAQGWVQVGAVTVALVGAPLPEPQPEQAWISARLADSWQVAAGDSLLLRLPSGPDFRLLSVRLAGTYATATRLPDLLVDGKWLEQQGVNLPSDEHLLVERVRDDAHGADALRLWLRRLPDQAKVLTDASLISVASGLVGVVLRDGNAVVSLLWVFLVLGAGTFLLLAYLDGRRELAILKSLGLRPWEGRLMLALESLRSGVLGFLLAGALSVALSRWLELPVVFTLGVYGSCLGLQALAFSLATAVPCQLGVAAGVNELIFQRPVAMFHSEVRGLTRRYPAWEDRLAAGLQCVRLPEAGICLCQPGKTVKQGEVVAWEQLAWGLLERRFVAPCDGMVVECDLESGLVVIQPAG